MDSFIAHKMISFGLWMMWFLIPYRLFGRTESVFVPKDKLYQDPPKEPRMSIRDMLVGSTAVASIEQPPDTFNLQLKRPLDMNSLEKGPPVKKRFIQDYQGKRPPPPPRYDVTITSPVMWCLFICCKKNQAKDSKGWSETKGVGVA